MGLEWRDGALVGVEVPGGGARTRAGFRGGEIRFGGSDGEPLTADRLQAFFQRCGFRSKRARLAVSGRDLSVKALELPALPPAERLEVLREDGDRFFLLPRGRRVYALLGETRDGRTLAAAAPEELIEKLVRLAGEAGLRVESVTASPAVYPAALRHLDDSGAGAGARSLVVREWGRERERVLYRDGRLVELRVSRGPAEGPSGVAPEEDGAIGTGSEAEGEGLGGEGGASLHVLSDPPPEGPPPGPGRLAGAVGVALAGPPDADLPDLLPEGIRGRRRRAERRLSVVLGGLAAALALGLLLAVPHARVRAAEAVDAALASAREAAAPVLAVEAEIGLISDQIESFSSVAGRPGHYLEVVTRLTEALPASAWVTSFISPEPTEVHLSGYGASAADVLRALASAPGVEDARLERAATRVRTSDGERESFDVVLRLSAPFPSVSGRADGSSQ